MKTLKKKLLSIMVVMLLAVSGILTAGCSTVGASGQSVKTGYDGSLSGCGTGTFHFRTVERADTFV